jgi:hypothetical protein
VRTLYPAQPLMPAPIHAVMNIIAGGRQRLHAAAEGIRARAARR